MPLVTPLTDDRFDAYYAVYARAYAREFDSPWLPVEKKVNLTDDPYGKNVALMALDDAGVIVGGGSATMPLQDNTAFAYLDVFTDPDRRREGHATAILDELMSSARAAGRTIGFLTPVWGVDTEHDPGREFAEARGFTLDMMDALRALDLPAELPPLEVADGYTLHSWRGPCPAVWLDEYAELRRILVQEAPNGEAGLENEYWDAARVRLDEADLIRSNRQMQVTVARAADGQLAGHTQLAFPGDSAEVYQWDTLVRGSHRGHGLGLALKIHTMRESADLLEGRRRIMTENAASNSYMIAVNERLGFRQIAWTGEYVRTI
ncbi:GNAT family N-acetyltransferase [Aeromicrobium sp.]|uniref:GNAT family N-acetyltransferase n=1 Tax=Aeromicrobium sp. TaxID=1871063 RepID=UPI0030BB84C1